MDGRWGCGTEKGTTDLTVANLIRSWNSPGSCVGLVRVYLDTTTLV